MRFWNSGRFWAVSCIPNINSDVSAARAQNLSYHYLERLENAVTLHEQWRNTECLNMIASRRTTPAQRRGGCSRPISATGTPPQTSSTGARGSQTRCRPSPRRWHGRSSTRGSPTSARSRGTSQTWPCSWGSPSEATRSSRSTRRTAATRGSPRTASGGSSA